EGDHLYLDTAHPLKNEALNAMLHHMESLEQKLKAKMMVLRDFPKDEELHGYFQGQGFVRMNMPEASEIDLTKSKSLDAYIANLSARNRRHLRKEILDTEPLLNIEILTKCSKPQWQQIEKLYANVHQNNLGLNTFPF